MIPAMVMFGPLTIHLYGLIVGLGMAAAIEITSRIGKQHGLSSESVWRVAIWAVSGGVIGARAYHVIDQWSYYSQHLVDVLKIWQGGLGIYGAVFGGVVGLWWGSRNKQKFFSVLDATAFGLPVGQAIGRWGNLINRELYGQPTTWPWGIMINGIRYQPLFLYESIAMLIVWGSLLWLHNKRSLVWGKGKYFAVYLMSYAVVRFLLEGWRINPWTIGGVAVARWVAAGTFILGLGWLKGGLKHESA